MVNSAAKDEQDGDVDMKVEIAPNTTYKVTSITYNDIEEEEIGTLTDDDIDFINDVKIELAKIEDNYTKGVNGKNNASKEAFKYIEAEIHKLINEYDEVLNYGKITMKTSGGGNDRVLNFSRSYNKEGSSLINVQLGNVTVDLEKVLVEKTKAKRIDQGVEVPEDFVETSEFGPSHGQKVYKKGTTYYSRDIGQKNGIAHNGGVWKVFENNGGRLKRIGTADKNLNIFKK